MRANSIRGLLNQDSPTLGTHLFLSSPLVVEIVGHAGVFDYVEFLAEYAPYDLAGFEEICRAAELHDLGTMIKVDYENHRLVAQRAVGAGFESVLYADPRSPADVDDCVRSTKPDTPEDGGHFGVGARRHALPLYGGTDAYVGALNDVVVAIMIEKKPAVDQLDEILAVPGIDFIQWGPADYAMSVGKPGRWDDDDITTVERRVIAASIEAGLRPRAEISTVDEARRYADLGVRDFCLGYDLFAIHDVLKDGGEQLRTTILKEAQG